LRGRVSPTWRFDEYSDFKQLRAAGRAGDDAGARRPLLIPGITGAAPLKPGQRVDVVEGIGALLRKGA